MNDIIETIKIIGDTTSKAIRWILDHIVVSVFIVFLGVVLYMISSYMTQQSVVYSPLKFMSSCKTTSGEIPYSYTGKTSYEESVTWFSASVDIVSDVSKTVSTVTDAVDIVSFFNTTTDEGGTFVIPPNASYVRAEDIAIYGWTKSFKKFFNQIDGKKLEVVLIAGNSAISARLEANMGILTEIIVYKLR